MVFAKVPTNIVGTFYSKLEFVKPRRVRVHTGRILTGQHLLAQNWICGLKTAPMQRPTRFLTRYSQAPATQVGQALLCGAHQIEM
jgi:hypothetical protein